jgi:hypothetical protein
MLLLHFRLLEVERLLVLGRVQKFLSGGVEVLVAR